MLQLAERGRCADFSEFSEIYEDNEVYEAFGLSLKLCVQYAGQEEEEE